MKPARLVIYREGKVTADLEITSDGIGSQSDQEEVEIEFFADPVDISVKLVEPNAQTAIARLERIIEQIKQQEDEVIRI